ncbi:MAG: ATP-binding protein, partial [Chloroflexota bacterium]|nr:ATP-binding protein [Chloroflexota bacterium]
ASEPELAKTQLLRSVDRLNAAIADLRGYVLGLTPVQAGEQPLSESLRLLAEQAGSNALTLVKVTIDEDAAASLSGASREAAYYVAADALGNIARHARARHAWLRLARLAGDVVLEISDDGVGFTTDAAGAGHGLRNMHERASAVGGTFAVESAPGKGARVRFEVPATPAEG